MKRGLVGLVKRDMFGGVDVHIRQIFVSPGHNYFGHHGQPAGGEPTVEVDSIRCVAGRGIEGDRFFDYKEDYKGQITFFAWEAYETLKREFSLPALSAGAFRRNVLVAGLHLAGLEGQRFVVQGVEFEGSGEAKPCYWMNEAVAPGAEEWLRGRGGLRARITRGGMLRTGPANFAFSADMEVESTLSLRSNAATVAALEGNRPKAWPSVE